MRTSPGSSALPLVAAAARMLASSRAIDIITAGNMAAIYQTQAAPQISNTGRTSETHLKDEHQMAHGVHCRCTRRKDMANPLGQTQRHARAARKGRCGDVAKQRAAHRGTRTRNLQPQIHVHLHWYNYTYTYFCWYSYSYTCFTRTSYVLDEGLERSFEIGVFIALQPLHSDCKHAHAHMHEPPLSIRTPHAACMFP